MYALAVQNKSGSPPNHPQNHVHEHQEDLSADACDGGGVDDPIIIIDHIEDSEKNVTLASGQVEPDVVTLATGGGSDIGQHLLTVGQTSVKADTQEIKVETENVILISPR